MTFFFCLYEKVFTGHLVSSSTVSINYWAQKNVLVDRNPFPGPSPSKCPRRLSSSGFSFGAKLILPQLWYLAERSLILSPHRWTCLTPGYPLYKLQSIYWCQAPPWSGVLPECALQAQKECGSIAVLPRALAATHIQTTKTIWCGHGPRDINNWKVSWSYQVYFKKTRAIQWFSAHCYSAISLLSAPWLLLKVLLKFHQVPSHAQFIFPHNCKMW